MPFRAVSIFSAQMPMNKTPEGPEHDGGRLIVFECVPEQYRKVYEWLKANPKERETGKLFRLRIPCVRAGKIYDWSPYVEQTKREAEFTGLFEKWPLTYRYELIPLEDELFLFQNGYESENDVTLPDFFTGLSKIQSLLFEEARKVNTLSIAIEVVCTKLYISKDLCKKHMRGLCRGNIPLAKRNGNTLVTEEIEACFPYYLVNGPYPYPVLTVIRVLRSMLKGASLAFIDGMPVCPPYLFERNLKGEIWSHGHTTKEGALIFPYGDDDEPNEKDYQVYFEEGNGTIHGRWKGTPRSSRIREGVFRFVYQNQKVIEFQTATEYLEEWMKQKSMAMALARPRAMQYEVTKKRFLRDLYERTVFEEQGVEHCIFIHETQEAKRTRIRRDYQGFYELMEIPVCEITPEIYPTKEQREEEERVLGNGYNARDTLDENLERFAHKYI
jgi:hypothetical protein